MLEYLKLFPDSEKNSEDNLTTATELPRVLKNMSEEEDVMYFGVELSEKLKMRLSRLRKDQGSDAMITKQRGNYPDDFIEENGYIYRKGKDGRYRIVILYCAQEEIIAYYHQAYGHVGIERTMTIIKRMFTWMWMKESIADYVSHCHLCGCAKKHFIRSVGQTKHIEIQKIIVH